jgi:hypothetical protein
MAVVEMLVHDVIVNNVCAWVAQTPLYQHHLLSVGIVVGGLLVIALFFYLRKHDENHDIIRDMSVSLEDPELDAESDEIYNIVESNLTSSNIDEALGAMRTVRAVLKIEYIPGSAVEYFKLLMRDNRPNKAFKLFHTHEVAFESLVSMPLLHKVSATMNGSSVLSTTWMNSLARDGSTRCAYNIKQRQLTADFAEKYTTLTQFVRDFKKDDRNNVDICGMSFMHRANLVADLRNAFGPALYQHVPTVIQGRSLQGL